VTRCGQCDGCRWGGVCSTEVYPNALADLHDGKGTEWKRTPDGAYYPTCDCHCPESMRKPSEARQNAPRRPRTAASATKPAESSKSQPSEPIDDATALRLLATWLKRLSNRKDP
jgi:hypothetical protein